ncbi:MAG: hypothetical protein RL557_1092 [archaeon]|jgi:VIT1/CCC1 family predicted Fe2+/Mn2+ transporter
MKKGIKTYIGSIVLGLNDALVELTGALAGLTLALQNPQLIAVVGLISGIAASLSMAASEYLSIKAEHNRRNPFASAFYTGIAYIFTVLFLIFPYLFVRNVYYALTWTLFNAVIVIVIFSYVSLRKEESFYRKFSEMLIISMSVALISFGIGYMVRIFFGVEV